MYILGISAFYHDSAASLLFNGEIIAAAQEERFTRIKNDSSFPIKAIQYCLAEASISLDDVAYITFYEKPLLKFERILETYASYAPAGLRSFLTSMPLWIKEKLFQKRLIIKHLEPLSTYPKSISDKLLFSEHHVSHAASAFYPSPFDRALVITLDGVGEWATTTIGIGDQTKLEIKKEIHFPHSLGLLYSAFTYYLGFKVNSDEYKVMGLAPYGSPVYADKILNTLLDVAEDGSFWLNMNYFGYGSGLTMINRHFEKLFGQPVRKHDQKLNRFHADMAASVQHVTENVVLKIVKHASESYNINSICLAGGVALNCVVNGKILRAFPDRKIWIQPAAGDAGGALGAALYTAFQKGAKRTVLPTDSMKGSLLGPGYSTQQIESFLREELIPYNHFPDHHELSNTVAGYLAEGKIIGWFQGRMEYGPRALGNRSILGDARIPDMQQTLNLKTKFRENFRPFAPAVLLDRKSDYFTLPVESPYMLLVDSIREEKKLFPSSLSDDIFSKVKEIRSAIPAVTHVDYSARIQTVDTNRNPEFHSLLYAFYERTGCPVIINTSFNVNNEPIVCSPEDAYQCFMATEIDVLVLGNYVVSKSAIKKGQLK